MLTLELPRGTALVLVVPEIKGASQILTVRFKSFACTTMGELGAPVDNASPFADSDPAIAVVHPAQAESLDDHADGLLFSLRPEVSGQDEVSPSKFFRGHSLGFLSAARPLSDQEPTRAA